MPGGSLASIHSQTEQAVIDTLRGKIGNESMWIGLRIKDHVCHIFQVFLLHFEVFKKNCSWFWVDGTDLDFENWKKGEPNCKSGDICAKSGKVLSGGNDTLKWSTRACYVGHLGLCKAKASQFPF